MSHRSLYQGNLTVIPQAPPLVPAPPVPAVVIPQAPPLVPALAPLRDPFAEGQALF